MEFKNFSESIKNVENGFIEGYLATYDVDSYNDVIVPGAFTKTLNESQSKIKYLFNHDISQPIGVIENIFEDDKGLFFSARISKTKPAQEKYEMAKEGVLDSNSIGYEAVKTDYSKDGLRYLREIKLYEGSLVTLPANENARVVNVKKLQNIRKFLLKKSDETSQLLAEELQNILLTLEGYDERIKKLEEILNQKPQSSESSDEALLEAIQSILEQN